VILQVVTRGNDPLTKPALDYLTSLGIPAELITRIQVDSPHGDIQTITVTMGVLVEAKEPKA
jgi:hypothetical protein